MMFAALFYLACQSTEPIAQDARLAANVTIEAPIITLQTLATRLSAETGVQIKVADNIQERKVTLFVRDRPARETMAALADTFFLAWTPDGKGYRLTLAKGLADEEAEAVRLDRERMQAKIDDTFAGWRELDSASPEQQAQEQAKLSRELKALAGATDQASANRRAVIERWLDLSSESGWSSFAVAYNGHQSEIDEALLAGRTLFASGRPDDDCPKLGESFKRNNAADPARRYDGAIALMHVDFAGAKLEGMFAFVGVHPGRGVPAGTRLLTGDDSAYRISKRFAKWSTVADTAVADLPLGPAPIRNPRLITLADQLAYLHQRTETPIVADAYRVPCTVGRQMVDTIGDFAAQLSTLSALRFAKGAVGFRLSSGWLEARHLLYWRLQPREMSEDVVKPMENLAARGTNPSTEASAALAASLTDIQVGGLNDEQCPTIVAFPTNQLGAFRSLRLWNALSEAQRLSARSRDGLGLDGLGPSQVALAKAALLQMFWNGTVTDQRLPLALGNQVAFASAKLFFEENEGPVPSDFTQFERMINPSMLTTDRVPGTFTWFYYGPSTTGALIDGFSVATR